MGIFEPARPAAHARGQDASAADPRGMVDVMEPRSARVPHLRAETAQLADDRLRL
jgi:hypothetical protein